MLTVLGSRLRLFTAISVFGALTSGSLATSEGPSTSTLQIGIDRSNLTAANEETREKTLEGIRSLGATWFRDNFAQTPHGVSDFVDVVRRAKQQNLMFLANVTQIDADYDTPLPVNRCGWRAKPLSQINLTKYTARLKAQLDAVKAAGLTIDAFEIGNEDDTDCYDADIPSGHAATPAEVTNALRGYGKFLKASAEVIRDPHYFPHAKLITFGIAHGNDQWDKPPHHISNPAHFVAMLRNVDGFNYLDNASYHVDGYGTHIYAWPNDVAKSVELTLQEDETALGKGKPFWITEWGFLDYKAFPNKKGETLSQAMSEYIATIDKLHTDVQLGPIMFYSYNTWLADSSGNLMPQANVLAARAKAK